MRKSGGKRKSGGALTVVARRKGWQRHLDALGFPTPRPYREWCRAQGFAPSLHKTWWQRAQEQGLAQRLARREEAIRIRARHIAALNFESVEPYHNWCAAQGFSLSLHKGETQYAKEREARQQERAAEVLTVARQRHDAPQVRIHALYANREEAALTAWERHVHLLLERALTRSPASRAALRDLLLVACRFPALLSLEPAIPNLGQACGNTYPDALLQLALRCREWRRPLTEWRPRERRARDLFGSLVRHLLAEYPVPAFLDAAWFQDDNGQARRQQGWFLHIGNGSNLRTAQSVPLALTSLATHHFLRAPRELSILAAMRWGQALGMGGSRRQAHAIVASRLREALPDEAFWTTVIQFFVNHPSLEVTQVGPLVDYIYHQRFEPMVVVGPDGEEISVAPLNPDFSMKGRSPAALLRQMQAWHRQLADLTKLPTRYWVASGIKPLNLTMQSATSGNVTFWATHELLCSKELEEEGRAMHNCVVSYVNACTEGRSALWSLRVWTPQDPTPRRVMTVEVCPETRTMVQARGKYNDCASDPRATPRLKAGLEALRHWAKQENLTIAPGSW
jgi:hypothetical protein